MRINHKKSLLDHREINWSLRIVHCVFLMTKDFLTVQTLFEKEKKTFCQESWSPFFPSKFSVSIRD